ncbi:MAG TPA: gamma-glutamyl-gamma-aminobutyrate hydrolase family protein [Halioglobus sp.]
MKLGILKTDAVNPEWVPDFGEYPDMFIALLGQADPGIEFAVYDVEQGQYPGEIDEVDAYLITGSKSAVYEDKPWIITLMAFVQELHRRHKKLVGICFGHQLVAHALGGKTEKSVKGWGVGLHTHRFSKAPSWHDQENMAFDILVSHEDQVVTAAQESQVLAGSEFCENAVCQVGEHILTFQGHPEFVPGYVREIMVNRREFIGENAYATGMASLSGVHEGQRVARWIINFLRA